jgi:hypothetical protein
LVGAVCRNENSVFFRILKLYYGIILKLAPVSQCHDYRTSKVLTNETWQKFASPDDYNLMLGRTMSISENGNKWIDCCFFLVKMGILEIIYQNKLLKTPNEGSFKLRKKIADIGIFCSLDILVADSVYHFISTDQVKGYDSDSVMVGCVYSQVFSSPL